MFTGLVREIGTLRAVTRRGGVTRLTVAAPGSAPRLAPGDSLAVNGICLTVTARRGPLVTLEAVAETRRVTTLGEWRAGRRVHLEPALRVGEGLDGHFVLGHVDGTGRVVAHERRPGAWRLTVALPAALARGLVPKGAIAVDGVSLTLDDRAADDRFTVSLVPRTLDATCLGSLRPGDAVNVELDALARAAARAGAAAAAGAPGAPRAPLTSADLLSRGFGRGGAA
ncbi:MAG: riboflavin synthase [Candidatus Krumholzibacteriia bacterium]